MGWKNLGEKPVVHTPWFRLNLADVELPGGRRLDHYVLRLPPVVLAAVLDGEDRVLMLWRHRFIPDTRAGRFRPASRIRPRTSRPPRRGKRYKESGWEPQDLQPLVRLESASGLTDSVSHAFWTRQAIRRGDPPAAFESERIDWVPLEQVPGLIAGGQIPSAVTATVLMMLLHRRPGGD